MTANERQREKRLMKEIEKYFCRDLVDAIVIVFHRDFFFSVRLIVRERAF